MSRTFVIGDIHGAYQALKQCLSRASFDYKNDTLICLGDVCDGWPETKACVEELLAITNLVYILGNHDLCARDWMRSGDADGTWLTQGGDATIRSYQDGVPPEHYDLFRRAKLFHCDQGRAFVHAGIDPSRSLESQTYRTFLWDRSIAQAAINHHARNIEDKLTEFDELYIGHTPISSDTPIYASGVWLMDTGAGWSGTLSMMDVDTKEQFVSDAVPQLYPNVMGRSMRTD